MSTIKICRGPKQKHHKIRGFNLLHQNPKLHIIFKTRTLTVNYPPSLPFILQNHHEFLFINQKTISYHSTIIFPHAYCKASQIAFFSFSPLLTLVTKDHNLVGFKSHKFKSFLPPPYFLNLTLFPIIKFHPFLPEKLKEKKRGSKRQSYEFHSRKPNQWPPQPWPSYF